MSANTALPAGGEYLVALCLYILVGMPFKGISATALPTINWLANQANAFRAFHNFRSVYPKLS